MFQKKNSTTNSCSTVTLDTYSYILPDMQNELAITVESILERR